MTTLRRRWLALLSAFAASLAVAMLSWSLPGLASLERVAYDWRLSLTAPAKEQDQRLILVTIDERAIAATRRRSPFDRYLLARALAQLDAAAPRAIGIDMLFDQRTSPAEDAALHDALVAMRAPVRLASASDPQLISSWQRQALDAFFRSMRGHDITPADATLAADFDGVIRRTGVGADHSLASALAMLAGVRAAPSDMPIEFVVARDADQPPFTELSLLDLLSDKPATRAAVAGLIRGRIVLIGLDVGGSDRFTTPLSIRRGGSSPGFAVHAHILRNLLQPDRPTALAWPIAAGWSALAALLGLWAGLLPLRAPARILLSLALVSLLCLIAIAIELPAGARSYGLPLVGAIAGWMLSSLVAGAVARGVTMEERRIAREIVGRYLPGDVAREIERDPQLLHVHGKRVPLTILFSDLADFTALSETLEPEILSDVLNAYLEGMTGIILSHGGTLDKFIGDAVVAFWGAPLPEPAGSTPALAAALAMQSFAKRHAADLAARAIALGPTRIGIHHGEAVVGNFGSTMRVQYTALGDAMNLAARLESANKQIGSLILASGEAMAQSAGFFCGPEGTCHDARISTLFLSNVFAL